MMKKSIRVVSEPQEQNTNHVSEQWLDDLIQQKRYIAQLHEELALLREEIKRKKADICAAEERLFVLIEEAGQKYLPFDESKHPKEAEESVDA